jgi:hypothetical protein
MTPVLERFNS